MPKFNWDAFFGGAVEKGLEGYKTAGTLAAANRELRDRELRTGIELGKSMPIEPYLEPDSEDYRVPGIGGLATTQLAQTSGTVPTSPDLIEGAEQQYGAAAAPGPAATSGTPAEPGFRTSPAMRTGYRIAQTGHFERLYQTLPEEARRAAIAAAEGKVEEQHRRDLAANLDDFNNRLKVYDTAARQVDAYRDQRAGIETVLAGIGQLQGPLYDLERRGLPVPDAMVGQLQAIGVPVQQGMSASQIAAIIDQYNDVMLKQKRDIDIDLGKYASSLKFVQDEVRRASKSLSAQYGIPEELIDDYINGTSDVRQVLNQQLFRFGAGRMRRGTRGAPPGGYSLPRAK